MARNKEVVGSEQKLKSHWVRCGSSGEVQWSNHFPPLNGLGQQVNRKKCEKTLWQKSLHSPLRDCPCCLKKCFCEIAKITPNKRAHLPQMFAQLLKTARNPWASRTEIATASLLGWGWGGGVMQATQQTSIWTHSSRVHCEINAALDIARATFSLQVLSSKHCLLGKWR